MSFVTKVTLLCDSCGTKFTEAINGHSNVDVVARSLADVAAASLWIEFPRYKRTVGHWCKTCADKPEGKPLRSARKTQAKVQGHSHL